MRRITIAAGLALSGALLVSGCQLVGGGGHGAKPGKTSQSTGGPQAQAAPTSGPTSSGVPSVSKQVTMPIPGSQGETFTLGFASLKVRGQLATLTLTWTPHGIGSDADSINDMNGGVGDNGEISMVDTVNLKRYVIVKDSEGYGLESDKVDTQAANDQAVPATYTFAAPPANASMDVYLDQRPVFESVPVT